MFFRERTTEWVAPKITTAIGAVLVIAVIGVFYLGLFSDGLIQRFSRPGTAVVVKAEK